MIDIHFPKYNRENEERNMKYYSSLTPPFFKVEVSFKNIFSNCVVNYL